MWHRKILERRAGWIRCVTTSRYPEESLERVLGRFGLSLLEGQLISVTQEQAKLILEAILWKDLAYSSPLMDRDQASALSTLFISEFAGSDTQFLSNGEWSEYHDREWSSFPSTPLTQSTFDAGIIALMPKMASCIWVEDED